VDHMRRKLPAKVGAAIYARRKTIVESVFGQIKQARLPAVSLAWFGEGARGVGGDLPHAQHSQVTAALLWIEEGKKGASFRGT